MELKTLRALTLKHINLSINMLNNPGLFNTSDSSFNILIEEQIFITLAFVGSFLERSNKTSTKIKHYLVTNIFGIIASMEKHLLNLLL